MGGFIGSLTGSNQAKAAKAAAAAQAAAAERAGSILDSAYMQGGDYLSNAATQGADVLQRGYGQSSDQLNKSFAGAGTFLTDAYNRGMGLQQPYADIGTQGAGMLGDALASGALTQRFGDTAFQADPSYQFRKQQGMDGIESSAAARGGLLSGAAMKALNAYNSNLASQEYGAAYDRFNNDQNGLYSRLMGVTQMGQGASNNMTNLASQYGGNMANNQMSLGQLLSQNILGGAQANQMGIQGSADARANALIGSGTARANALTGVANANASGLIGAANARAAGAANLLKLGGQAAAAVASGMTGGMPGGMPGMGVA